MSHAVRPLASLQQHLDFHLRRIRELARQPELHVSSEAVHEATLALADLERRHYDPQASLVPVRLLGGASAPQAVTPEGGGQ